MHPSLPTYIYIYIRSHFGSSHLLAAPRMAPMSHTYDAVRAIADAVIASQCSSRIGSSLIASAVRAAAAMDSNKTLGEVPEPLAEAVGHSVDARLAALRPVLIAQATEGLATGVNHHSPAGLASPESIVRANVARHSGFDNPKLVSEMSKGDLRRCQRGSRKQRKQHEEQQQEEQQHEKQHPPSTDEPRGDLDMLVGVWRSDDHEKITVFRSEMGVCAGFGTTFYELSLFKEGDGVVKLNGWEIFDRTTQRIQWKKKDDSESDDKELVWTRL